MRIFIKTVIVGCSITKFIAFKIILFFLFACNATAFLQTPFFVNFDTKDGLPSSETYGIHFSKDKRAWFTTDRGVAVYNGYQFRSFSTEHGLADNTNFTIFEDSNNQLWFTGFDGSLSLYKDGVFQTSKLTDTLKGYLEKGFYNTPIEDEEGYLLFFDRFKEFSDNTFILVNGVNHAIKVLSPAEVKARYPTKYGKKIDLTIINNKAIPFSREFSFFKPFNKHGTDWVGIDENTIFKLDQEGKIKKQFRLKAKLAEFSVIDNNDDLWIGTNDGLLFLKDADLSGKIKHLFPNLIITDLKQDYEGSFWMSTIERGVFFIPNFKMNTIGLLEERNDYGRILSVAGLEQRIYFGSSRRRILSVNKKNKFDIIYEPLNEYIGSFNNAYKKDNRVYFRDFFVEEEEDKISVDKIKRHGAILTESEDETFFSTSSNLYILRAKGKSKPTTQIIDDTYQSKIHCVEEDETGNVWLGTQQGLFKIDADNYPNNEDASNNHPALKERINDLKTDTHDHLWIATIGHGLVYKTTDSLYHITTNEGLHSNLINCIYLEDEHTIWLGTNQGLNKLSYDWKDGHFTINNIWKYGVLDGLLSNFINDIDYWNDHLWLATNKGISFIKPENLRANYPLVPIYLENFKVNGIVRNHTENITLEPQENDILLQLTGISYRKEDITGFYRYRLSGPDSKGEWVYTNDRNIRFIDLPPGQYTFEAAAKNKSNRWSDAPIHMQIEIKPYFTQTTQFRVLVMALLLILVGLVFLLRDRQLKRRNALQKRLMEANIQSKEYELSALRNQMNPHFVFNSLNAIQNFIFKNDSRKANYYLSKFSRLMRDSLKFSRIKYISLKEEVDFLTTYLELEQMRFPDKFKYQFFIEEHIPVRQYTIPSLLFQPILENIIKHAFKEITYKGLLTIDIREVIPGKKLFVRIEDNGPGFAGDFFDSTDEPNQHKSLGLTIVKNQIDLLNANKEGREASFKIINLKDFDPRKMALELILKFQSSHCFVSPKHLK